MKVGIPRHAFHSPYPTAGSTYCRSLRARSPFTRPCRSFCCAYAELIRDQMPPDDFCNCYFDVRATKPTTLVSSQGRWPRPPSFSSRTTPLIAEQWCVASRATSASACPGAGSSRLPRFAQPRCLQERLTTARVLPRSMHSEDWRARVRGPSEGRVPIRMQRCPVPAPGTYAYDCVGRRRSPPRIPRGHPLSPARSLPADEAAGIDHEPTKAFVPASHREACRLPENRDAFEPSCHARDFFLARRDCSLRPSRQLSRSRRPHFFPRLGRVLCWALQVSRCGHPRSVNVPPAGGPRVQTPFLLPWSCLGLTTQACPAARPTRPSTDADCSARTDVGRSA